MTDIQWKRGDRSPNPETLFTTGLNSLANDAGALSSIITNTVSDEFDLFVDLELVVTFGTTPVEDSLIETIIVITIDGTNYMTNTTEGRPRAGSIGGFQLDNVTTLQRIPIAHILLPPEDFKLFVINKSGQAFPASGSTIKGLFYLEEAV